MKALAVSITVSIAAAPLTAQIPQKFENLRVLPEDVERAELLDTMRGFSFSLGVRCEFCHVSRGGTALSDFDFAADDKESKGIARRMMAMVRAINTEHLANLGRDAVLTVDCATCHRGIPRPEAIEALVMRMVETSGLDAALARYRELRSEHYGTAAYDFGVAPLNRLGERLIAEGRLDVAVALLELNGEFHPETVRVFQLLGNAFLEKGDRDAARTSFERVLSLDPENAQARKRLDELRR